MMQALPKSNYWQAIEPLARVTVNNLFALFVVEKKISGTILVDDSNHPKTFYVVHPYGMSLLFGASENEAFNTSLIDYMLNSIKNRSKPEWLQVFPDNWNSIIRKKLGNRLVSSKDHIKNLEGYVEENTRVNFRFNLPVYRNFRLSLGQCDCEVLRSENSAFSLMKGTVVPANFWDSSDDFAKNGVSFSIFKHDEPVCTAYSAYTFPGCLELGIETTEKYRGKGYALHTCIALIDYCLEKGYEPIWSCRLENSGSYKLAQKLGFEPTLTFPFYRLPV
jgi:hypothetical protein